MQDLEKQLIQANLQGSRFKLIVTDGVFSMDGVVAPLDKICDLADKYDALVMIDECHAAGFIGATGKGTAEVKGVMGRVDIITGTLGKALGGAMGGYTTAKKEIIEIRLKKLQWWGHAVLNSGVANGIVDLRLVARQFAWDSFLKGQWIERVFER